MTIKIQSFFHFCPVTVTVALPFGGQRSSSFLNVPHRSSTLPIVPQRDIPLPIVPQRDIPLPTVTQRYTPLLTVTHRYFNVTSTLLIVTPTKLYGLLNEKIFIVCLA